MTLFFVLAFTFCLASATKEKYSYRPVVENIIAVGFNQRIEYIAAWIAGRKKLLLPLVSTNG